MSFASSPNRPTVMIVDDSASMRALIASLVAGIAGEIIECDDGSVAIRQFRERRPDLVLMDIGMRGTDGLTATRAIRLNDASAQIVIVTDYAGDPLRRAARDAGAIGFFQKDQLAELPGWLVAFTTGFPAS
ncbi:MAG: response regulator transcription factor [Gemmatimonadaceae bacterium]|nr:response regulator transcription factor [Gemmatimonadaceae bacterium]MCW5826936.1 response regulator transcription factor [Gemmatimonadaceae bacterium]